MKKEETVDFHIKSTWHAISRMYNQKAQRYGVSTSMGFVLLNINPDYGTRATKIAPLIGLETTSLSRMLKSMEVQGLIERKPDPDDGRAVRIFLTKLGQEKQLTAKDAVLKFNEEVYSILTAKELKGFFETVEKINKVIDTITL